VVFALFAGLILMFCRCKRNQSKKSAAAKDYEMDSVRPSIVTAQQNQAPPPYYPASGLDNKALEHSMDLALSMEDQKTALYATQNGYSYHPGSGVVGVGLGGGVVGVGVGGSVVSGMGGGMVGVGGIGGSGVGVNGMPGLNAHTMPGNECEYLKNIYLLPFKKEKYMYTTRIPDFHFKIKKKNFKIIKEDSAQTYSLFNKKKHFTTTCC